MTIVIVTVIIVTVVIVTVAIAKKTFRVSKGKKNLKFCNSMFVTQIL
jgi:hypothetical protein